jgi:hypothetical protein
VTGVVQPAYFVTSMIYFAYRHPNPPAASRYEAFHIPERCLAIFPYARDRDIIRERLDYIYCLLSLQITQCPLQLSGE